MNDNKVVAIVPNLEAQDERIASVIGEVRDELKTNPYFLETLKVLSAGGYRSAIGSFWNLVVDDLRNKILFRSADLFNKEMKPSKPVKVYEDFQDTISDEALIDGAYKMGVISWEAHKMLKQAKDDRHVFSGHPKSSEPTLIKVLSMMEDCIKYVLGQPYPPQIIDVDSYVAKMGDPDFDSSEIGIQNAIDDLPETYLKQLANMLFTKFVDKGCPSNLKNNIQAVSPVVWGQLTNELRDALAKRVDTEISRADKVTIGAAFDFIGIVDGYRYLTASSRRYLLGPIISELESGLDDFATENRCVEQLFPYAGFIPRDLVYQYVNALTQTYVGRIGSSYYFPRTDFYADRAALLIPKMFEKFDGYSIDCFIESVRNNSVLKNRVLSNAVKMRRLRTLGNVIFSVMSSSHPKAEFIQALVDESMEVDFVRMMK